MYIYALAIRAAVPDYMNRVREILNKSPAPTVRENHGEYIAEELRKIQK